MVVENWLDACSSVTDVEAGPHSNLALVLRWTQDKVLTPTLNPEVFEGFSKGKILVAIIPLY